VVAKTAEYSWDSALYRTVCWESVAGQWEDIVLPSVTGSEDIGLFPWCGRQLLIRAFKPLKVEVQAVTSRRERRKTKGAHPEGSAPFSDDM